jgi:hypothetical protein
MRGRKYERPVASLIEDLAMRDLVIKPTIKHRHKYTGKSGQTYEIDISYIFRVSEADYLTLVECKHWNKRVGCDVIAAFHAVIEDIGAHKGIVVTSVGFQKGAIGLAGKNGIALFKMSDSDEAEKMSWEEFWRMGAISSPFDVIGFLSKKSAPYRGDPVQRRAGIAPVKRHIVDHIYDRYGEEVAAFLNDDEQHSIRELEDSSLKNKIKQQIAAMGENWFIEYLEIESCALPLEVMPLLYLERMAMKIMNAKMEIEKGDA